MFVFSIPFDKAITHRRFTVTSFRWTFFLFHGFDFLLTTRVIADCKEWDVRTGRMRWRRAAKSWEHFQLVFVNFVDFCKLNDISAIVDVSPRAVEATIWLRKQIQVTPESAKPWTRYAPSADDVEEQLRCLLDDFSARPIPPSKRFDSGAGI